MTTTTKSHLCDCGKRTSHKVFTSINTDARGWREVQIGWDCKCGTFTSICTHDDDFDA